MIFFTSDTHFGGEDIITREHRPFKNAKQMNRLIVKLWNKQAKKTDTIYHLGDFINYNVNDGTSWKKSLKLVKKIRAKVVLIIGNNEERIIKLHFKNNFDEFKNYCIKLGFLNVLKEETVTINGKTFYLNHYPKNHKDRVINLFGHVHRITGIWKPFGFNVGCDCNHFSLFSYDDIMVLMSHSKKWWANDLDVLS